MNTELMFFINRTSKYAKELLAIKESICVRRKQLEMKQSTQSASKMEYYRKELERDRTARESKLQNIKEDLEAKLERLKREYEANVKDITDKLERKESKIKEESDTYQRYCNINMNQDINEDSDSVIVKLKEQLAITQEHHDKCYLLEQEHQVKVTRWKQQEALIQLKLEEEKFARKEEEILNKQRMEAIAREESIRKEVARCKAEKEKYREEQEEATNKIVQPETDKKINDRDDLRRVQEYSKAIYSEDLPLFNLLTLKEKVSLIKGQNLDKQVKEYQDNLRSDKDRKVLSDFLDATERDRYRKALGEEVLQEQRSLIEEFAKKNLILKEYIDEIKKPETEKK
jgi:hypothetical protein